ncbi:glycosyltransferase family 2 protein [Pontibacter lucknowensis]|uniref:Glycosyltransferase, catalytic subunit of cellulose synthase and poly-beta-1,6-N-acetylglucosamine synthase n=1 Tax=Pontibacter lucknowensis TaxID=1077936 RepID=A0A1N6WC06_9BACT|nr:glycosyltransferase [Pontibacter lucknowensis]SIQ87713.1 Glycosyltransferase, catalytic subunit of cellulose synthase and poly-beta-1,6-N-acetylglucosamine synthase [Pontibacter lucknowensis]
MFVLLLLSLLAYAWIILRCLSAWKRLPIPTVPAGFIPATQLSVIIPVRNEARQILNLLRDLESQNYPAELFEVLVVDDHSDDGTAQLIQEFIPATKLNLRLIRLAGHTESTGKKAAIKQGIAQTSNELLVFTDGDCRVQPDWLLCFAYTYETQQSFFISGPVSFRNTHTLLERMQLVEFASLIGVGGASIGLRQPNMCNGANLAYTREVFEEVGGFAGNEGIASGDDEFLLHKVSQLYPERIAFLKHPGATVYTEARKTVRSFIAQRVRWASKWRSYQSLNVKLVALTVFTVNLLLFLAIPGLLLGWLSFWTFLAAYAAKFLIDFLFLNQILTFMGRQNYLIFMLPLQLVYIPYVLYTAISGLTGRYTWKGRIIRNHD